MQQLTRRRLEDDEGAAAVVMAILMIPVLGIAALAIDAGALYAEKAGLQNGADAAAVAIAARCAKGLPTCSTTAYGSDVTAVANANDPVDGLQSIVSVTRPTARSVRVTTGTRTADGAGIAHPFLTAMNAMLGTPDRPATSLRATATASWSSPGAADGVLPLAFSLCGVQSALLGGTKMLLRSDQNNGTPACLAADGHPIAGGFGWLATNGTCRATIKAGDLVASDQGNDLPSVCSGLLSPHSLIGRVVQVPVFDCAAAADGTCLSVIGQHTGTQSSDRYRIYGFAAFRVTGHRLSGSDSATDPSFLGALRCTGNCRGLQGTFIRWSFTDPSPAIPGPDLGASVVRLSE
ncbi:TadE/TadG family type IV pilus assembly protein [Amnibacterium endophyticum]|uniref:TadE/TadG family type IV pilus assembly protein n=1 Tax=Amnibacterium endophyticum TaxID=2109337 RepID=A0ABW4L8R8_9MICO